MTFHKVNHRKSGISSVTIVEWVLLRVTNHQFLPRMNGMSLKLKELKFEAEKWTKLNIEFYSNLVKFEFWLKLLKYKIDRYIIYYYSFFFICHPIMHAMTTFKLWSLKHTILHRFGHEKWYLLFVIKVLRYH